MKKKEARKQKLMEKNKISRMEKKRKKKLELLEREMLEARGEEGKKVKEKFFTEATKLVFTIYFRILKSFPRSNLMGEFKNICRKKIFKTVKNVPYTLFKNKFIQIPGNSSFSILKQ